jgi:GNAT superfamily N-acetyltransferase
MVYKYEITNMHENDIDKAIEIWVSQYRRYCSGNDAFPVYWRDKTKELEEFLRDKIQNECAVVARLENEVVGFLSYDEFHFNGEETIFCPIIGHSAVEEYKEEVYLSLYKNISQKSVDKGIFNHMWTIFYNDTELRSILFEVGYGSYLIDAFSSLNIDDNNVSLYEVREATAKDADTLCRLVEESREYYKAAPLFLRRDRMSNEEVAQVIENCNVYIAWDGDTAVGFINVSISEENNVFDMSTCNSGLIDEIGAYIKYEYRGKNIGKALLESISKCCSNKHVSSIHVDFETANLYGNKFWKKYFEPMLLSMRRTINKDINM